METKPVFQLSNILLIESTFKREVTFDNESYGKAENALDVSSARTPPEGEDFAVYLTITFKQTSKEITFLETKVTMVGMFKKSATVPADDFEKFCTINAPAIIFPFIRETIASMTLKAGIQPILIQPLNFVEIAKQTQSQPVAAIK